MTTRQMMDILQRSYPELGSKEVLIYIDQAFKEFCIRTRIIVPSTFEIVMDSQSSYNIATMEPDIDTIVSASQIYFEVKSVFVDGKMIPHASAEARTGLPVWETDGVKIVLFKKNSDETTTEYTSPGSTLQAFCELRGLDLDSDTSEIPIPTELHTGILSGARILCTEATGQIEPLRLLAERYEFAVREGIKLRNTRGVSGPINVKPYDY